MADENVTTTRVSSEEFLHASARVGDDVKSDGMGERDFLSVIEEALEEERARLMLVNSVLGCVQAALDPEAVGVEPAIYFPEVLAMARKLINESVGRLEGEEIRRLVWGRRGSAH